MNTPVAVRSVVLVDPRQLPFLLSCRIRYAAWKMRDRPTGIKKAAKMAGVGVRTIYAAFRSGNLAASRLGDYEIILTLMWAREWMHRTGVDHEKDNDDVNAS